ncbi:hypothetical protein DACRYDRAFT_118149 [Dacryopinax primogenitus]|uniref:Uncharacterized protein n=1 Tax=Dacryopinax primogenitus (strain DJM 731) TaxID=1858805 RepID=M5G0S6_DACPD|nr:uncharacterized protein DACRYDRAFT_118149 [Dacryopinax primogenitus]EJT99436.1 hypothetical protein DACRYDRAFT_118149 [Dacryopinax primogenitus]
MRTSSVAVLAVALAASTLAAPVNLEQDAAGLEARADFAKVEHTVAHHVDENAGVYNTIANGAMNVINSRSIDDEAAPELTEREFQELVGRNWLTGMGKRIFRPRHAIVNHLQENQEQNQERSLDDEMELDERDLEELDQLEPRLFGFIKRLRNKIFGGNSNNIQNNNQNYNQEYQKRSLDDEMELDGRDLEEFDQLEPRLFGFVKRIGHRFFGSGVGHSNNNQEYTQKRSLEDVEQLNARDLEDLLELDEREIDEFLDSFDERGIEALASRMLHHHNAKKAAAAAAAAETEVDNNQQAQPQPQPQPQPRSLEDIDDEIDLSARSMPEEELDFEPFSARSVPEDELEWTVDMRDVEGEENLVERNKAGQVFSKVLNII